MWIQWREYQGVIEVRLRDRLRVLADARKVTGVGVASLRR